MTRALVIVLLTLACYIPALRAGYVWDDQAHVTENAVLRTADGLSRIWFEPRSIPQYYPLVHTFFWLEYRLWGLEPFGYHLVNVLLHAACAILLLFLLERLKVRGAFLAAAVFAVHPVCVESVAWITERKNVLSLFFYLSAGSAYLKYALGSARREGWYMLSFFFFLCALLSKTVTCTLPAALLLVLWWRKKALRWRDAALLVPFFAAGLVMGLVTANLEESHVGARGEEWSLSFPERMLLAGRVPWFYAWKLLLPIRLTFIYPRWRIDAGEAWQYLFPVALIAVILALYFLRRRTGKGILVGVLFFVGSLFPAMGFFNVYPMRYSYVADHFQYLASLGLVALFAAGAATVADRFLSGKKYLPPVLCAVLLATFGTLTWRQSLVYENMETLWRDVVAKDPESWMAHNNLGLVLEGKGAHEEALGHYRAAVRLKPDHVETLNNLGTALLDRGEIEEAFRYLEKARKLAPRDPITLNNLGNVCAKRGDLDEAIDFYYEALKSRPEYSKALRNLGNAYAKQGKLEQAEHFYQRARKNDTRKNDTR